MKKILVLVLLAAAGCLLWLAFKPGPLTPQEAARLKAAQSADQLVLVGATGGSDAILSFYEKNGGAWQEVFSRKAYIGKNGLGKEREGDAKTPVGAFHFTKAFGIAPDPGCPMGYVQVDDTHYWVGDGNSPLYNQFASTRDHDDFDKAESEHIIEYAKPYVYCLNISYNEQGKPGLGSAIFLHCYSQNTYTGGCVAIPEEDMRLLLRKVRPGCTIVIARLQDLKAY